ncbi:hypothetical protein [Rhodopseudomonas palustris]|uniref:hypothetical protein n=1 Tax=Rhodopseudomonas palustris TaxID=1076 RepID=UPI001058A678|nr:hypothetical protein [Rhodopseudomonas palustris]QLH71875.1 hypothetical protein HZF03_14195 [Rhodopseudomonas palustris]
MLSVTTGRRLLLTILLLALAPPFWSELVLYLAKDSRLGCGLAAYSSTVWPSLNEEITVVRTLLPRDECAFVLLKSTNLFLSGAIALIFVAIFLRSFHPSEDLLFLSMQKTSLFLMICGVACFFVFRSYAIFNLTVAEATPLRRHMLLRTSIMSPIVVTDLVLLGLLTLLVRKNMKDSR